MNIFYVDLDPRVAARSLADTHVCKMIVESAQMLSTAHHVLRSPHPFRHEMYKLFNPNHPCNKWVRSSPQAYYWLYQHFRALCDEYTHRFYKTHKTGKLQGHLVTSPFKRQQGEFSPPPMVMHEGFLLSPSSFSPGTFEFTRDAYRFYYRAAKSHLHRYTNREPPEWLLKAA